MKKKLTRKQRKQLMIDCLYPAHVKKSHLYLFNIGVDEDDWGYSKLSKKKKKSCDDYFNKLLESICKK